MNPATVVELRIAVRMYSIRHDRTVLGLMAPSSRGMIALLGSSFRFLLKGLVSVRPPPPILFFHDGFDFGSGSPLHCVRC